LSGKQVQIDQTVILPHADRALVETHAVEAQPGSCPGDDAGQAEKRLLLHPRASAKLVQILIHEEASILLEIASVLLDESGINRAHHEKHSPESVEQCDIAAGGDR
jgi:hypothetical protein